MAFCNFYAALYITGTQFYSLRDVLVVLLSYYLIGIRSMQDHGSKKPIAPIKRKKSAPRKKTFKKPRDNEHLADVLETYEDNSLTLKGQP